MDLGGIARGDLAKGRLIACLELATRSASLAPCLLKGARLARRKKHQRWQSRSWLRTHL